MRQDEAVGAFARAFEGPRVQRLADREECPLAAFLRKRAFPHDDHVPA